MSLFLLVNHYSCFLPLVHSLDPHCFIWWVPLSRLLVLFYFCFFPWDGSLKNLFAFSMAVPGGVTNALSLITGRQGRHSPGKILCFSCFSPTLGSLFPWCLFSVFYPYSPNPGEWQPVYFHFLFLSTFASRSELHLCELTEGPAWLSVWVNSFWSHKFYFRGLTEGPACLIYYGLAVFGPANFTFAG